MSKTFMSIRVEPDLQKKVEELAKAEKRTVASQTNYLMELGLKNKEGRTGTADVGHNDFRFQDRPVRIVEKNGEPWFVAKDVAEVLGYVWNGTECIRHVPEEWRGVSSVLTPSANQEMAVLSEPGLYFFLGRSDKPLALPFQKWIAEEVIPSIRKKGFYAIPGRDREEQDEWKKNFPYPFLLLDDAARKMRELRFSVDKGLISPPEWRKIVLGDFGSPEEQDSAVVTFIKTNVKITGNMNDYIRADALYSRYKTQAANPMSQGLLTRKIKNYFPGLIHKQKKITNYPVLVFLGCKFLEVNNE